MRLKVSPVQETLERSWCPPRQDCLRPPPQRISKPAPQAAKSKHIIGYNPRMRSACLLAMFAVLSLAQDPEKFYSAIRDNNLAQMNALLDQKASANLADNHGITPLMYAAEIGSVDAMRVLIDHGADVNAQNDFGSTALMWSVSDPSKVRLLLDHGAQVNLTARSGRTALIIAAFTNPSAEVVRLLLAKGAKVEVMDKRHVTPMNAATFGNDTATVQLLLDAGADIETADTFIGLTPLMNAAGNRNLKAVKLLLAKGAKVNAVSKTEGLPKIQTGTVEFGGWTPLLMAAAFGPPEAVNVLLDAAGANRRAGLSRFHAVDAGRRNRPVRSPNRKHAGGSRRRSASDESRRRDSARLGLQVRRPGGGPRVGRDSEGPRQAASRLSEEVPDAPHCRLRAAFSCWNARTTSSFTRPVASPAMNSLRPSLPPQRHAPRAFRWMRKRRTNGFCKSPLPSTRSRWKERPR